MRRTLHARNIACVAAGLLLGLFATLALGQAYPNRAIRLIVDTSPEQGDLEGRGHFERGFRHKRPDAKKVLA